MAVTFDGSFLCLRHFELKIYSKWQVTNTMMKQCKYSWKPVKNEPH